MWAVTVRGISCAEARVLWHLADCHNPVEGCFPSQEYLAEACEIDERSVRRNLLSLKAKGLVNWSEQREGKYRKNNRYALAFETGFVSGAGEFEPGNLSGSENGASTGQNCTFEPDISVVLNRTPESSKPVIEPVINLKAGARDRAPEEGGLKRVDRKRIEREFVLWFSSWKKGDVDFARNSWFALSDEERAECIAKTPAYLRWAKPADLMAGAVFLKQRHWRDAPDEAPPVATYNPFSRAWMALRISELLKPMATAFPPLTAFQRMEVQRGTEAAKAVDLERRAKYGWPKVNTLHELKPVTVSPGLVALSEGFERVHCDSDKAERWRALHARQGWPWLPKTAHEWLYFPAGEPEDAIAEFQRNMSEGRGNDDAA
ncbi:helix-turn-helix domain-containing protein [Rhizobium sp. SGZ-381]|uniref:helix-turn-helix domain-containing protein n=1 Tax=Rhizobium sp. SGZ-381 TaxID=3342800 RepID=UPI00367219FC